MEPYFFIYAAILLWGSIFRHIDYETGCFFSDNGYPMLWLWYSQQHSDLLSSYHFSTPRHRNFARMENGSIKEYSIANGTEKKHGSKWRDIVYLGRGQWHHNEAFL